MVRLGQSGYGFPVLWDVPGDLSNSRRMVREDQSVINNKGLHPTVHPPPPQPSLRTSSLGPRASRFLDPGVFVTKTIAKPI